MLDKLKVLVLVPDLSAPGGVSSFFNSLKGQFKLSDITYVTRGSRFKLSPLLQPIVKLLDYVKFTYQIVSSGCDLIHVNTSLGSKNLYRDPWFILIAKLFGKKTLVFFHGWKPDCVTGYKIHLLRLMFSADSVIVLAGQFKEQLVSWGYSKPIYIESTVVAKEMEQLLSNVKTRELKDEVKILFLSRIEIAKGIYESIQAFQMLQGLSNRDLKFVVAGDGSELENVKRYTEKHKIPDVTFCGYVTGVEKARVLSEAHIYLLPSYSEGMPISVLEAMLAGLAVITRSTGGLVDIFTDNMGRITESKDPKILAELLNCIISHPGTLSEISAFNRSFAEQNFTVDPFIERLESIYSKV